MPGLVRMDNRGANGPVPPPITGKRTAQEAFGEQDGKADATKNTLLNGDVSSPQQNGPVQPRQSSMPDSPPALQHITEGYLPLGQLIARTAQVSLNDLGETVDKLSLVQRGSRTAPALPNGIGAHASMNGGASTSKAGTEQKKDILESLNTQREKFIKLLVLGDWSQKVDDVGKLIDLNVFNQQQFTAFDHAKFRIADMHRRQQYFKEKAPDIKTAIEVLGTGKASWMPDLGYLPKPLLTAQKALRALQDMNIALRIRLNVHEDLPLYLRNHRIHDGRVTFSFPGEFELDVTIVNEEPTSPFYFIDVRFLFEPKTSLSGGVARTMLTQQTLDPILKSKGIPGCCEFLHNFVLTHKITILKKQVLQMQGSDWARTLRVDQIHRSLIIQYWIDPYNPTKKSWIEIGVASGKPKTGKLKPRLDGREWISCLEVRWFRDGKKSTPVPVSFDFDKLDMRAMMNKVVALHINHILGSIRDKLLESEAGGKALTVKLNASETEPEECNLQLRLGRDSPWTSVSIQPVSGRLSFDPTGRAAVFYENEINKMKDPAIDAHKTIAVHLATQMEKRIENEAVRRGWKTAKNLKFDIKDLGKAVFKTKILRAVFFYLPGWSSCNYIVAVTINLGGCNWWITEVQNRVTGGKVLATRAIGHYGTKQSSLVTQEFLKAMEYNAAQEVALWTASTQLDSAGVQNAIQSESVTKLAPHQLVRTNVQACLRVKYSDLKAHYKQELAERTSINPGTVEPALLIGLKDFNDAKGMCELVARGDFHTDKGQMDIFSTFQDSNVYFLSDDDSEDKNEHEAILKAFEEAEEKGRKPIPKPGTEFAFYLDVRIGQSCVDQLVKLLHASIRVRNFLAAIAEARFTPTKSSLSELSFTYSADPTLTADITFSTEIKGKYKVKVRAICNPTDSRSVGYTVRMLDKNPHRRMQSALVQHLNTSQASDNVYTRFCKTLVLTLPFLRTFDELEFWMLGRGDVSNPSLHPRSLDHFKITYSNPPCAWEVRLRRGRNDLDEWIINEGDSQWSPILPNATFKDSPQRQAAREGRDEEFVTQVRKLFWDIDEADMDAGWVGERSCIRSPWEGIGEALKKLNAVVTKFRSEERNLSRSMSLRREEPGPTPPAPLKGQGGAAGGAQGKQKSAVAVGAEVVVLD